MIHPEFPARITALVWDAAFRRLDTETYRSFFTGGLAKAEVEDLFLGASFTPPALGVCLGAIDHDPLAGEAADQTTVIDITIVWQPPARSRDTADDLRARVIDAIRATLSADYGRLTDPEGAPLTEALLRFQRLQPVEAVPRGKPQYLLDRLRVAYRSLVGPDFQFLE